MVRDDEDEESELRMVTRRTTNSMQIETGVIILMISSPTDSRMLLSFALRSIWGFRF